MRRCNNTYPYRQCEACLRGVSLVQDHARWINENLNGLVYGSTNAMPIEKPVVGVPGGGTLGPTGGGSWRVLCPTVLEYLSDTCYSDGNPRETATLLLFVDGQDFKICLSDRDTGRTLWATGGDFDTALSALEARLMNGNAEWRVNTRLAKGKKK